MTVAFEEGALPFLLSKDATFQDLGDLDELHRGKPVAIDVKLAALCHGDSGIRRVSGRRTEDTLNSLRQSRVAVA